MNRVQDALRLIGVAGDLQAIGIGDTWSAGRGEALVCRSPIDGSELARFPLATADQAAAAADAAAEAFHTWRLVPAPVRGEFVRRFGERLRTHKQDLATLVTWEVGKITQESLGEVQEMIDVCDFAVGLSRQLYGKTIATELQWPESRDQDV